jgi:hypothetical protein
MKYYCVLLLGVLFTACGSVEPVPVTVVVSEETAVSTPIIPLTTSPTETVTLTSIPPTSTHTPVPTPIATSLPQSDGDSYSPEISDNGRYIAFISRGKMTENAIHDALYVYDRETSQIELVSVALDGKSSEGRPFNIALSSSGRYVGFHSHGGDLVVGDDELCDSGRSNCGDLFIYDRQLEEMRQVPIGFGTGEGSKYRPWVNFSPDERFFYSNGAVYDLNTGELDHTITTPDYHIPNGPSLHFWNTQDIFNEGENIILPFQPHEFNDASSGGASVAFLTESSDITNDSFSQCVDGRFSEGLRPCKNIFIHDLETEETWLATLGIDGLPSNGDTSWPRMSANGHFLTFSSFATNLTGDDLSLCHDGYDCNNVFLHDLQTGETMLISREIDNHLPAGYSRIGDISGDGRFVTFSSGSDKLVHDDTNEVDDVFVYDRLTEEITRISVPNTP